jgi:cofilin
MPYTDCRYGVFDQDYTTKDGRKASKLWFVSWLPMNATPYHKMAYTSAKTKFRETLTGIFDFQASTYVLTLPFLSIYMLRIYEFVQTWL